MKLIISPAKSLDFESNVPTSSFSQACFLEQAKIVHKSLVKKTPKQLTQLMNISEKLAQLNWERNQNWNPDFSKKNTKNDRARQAIYAFKGDVYLGLDAYNISSQKIPVLQEKVRILSGLYGILKPLDLIQAYRLEMGTKLKTGKYNNMHSFWQETLTDFINEELEENEPLINLASDEYFSALIPQKIKAPVYKIIFKDFKNGKYKFVQFFAKKARGLMARFVVENNIKKTEDLKNFNYKGYTFSGEESSKDIYVFLRKHIIAA